MRDSGWLTIDQGYKELASRIIQPALPDILDIIAPFPGIGAECQHSVPILLKRSSYFYMWHNSSSSSSLYHHYNMESLRFGGWDTGKRAVVALKLKRRRKANFPPPLAYGLDEPV